ncbi:transglutaminase-like cysteine peptidase [Chitinilyticum litopenaei]|uniref:Transglutaminase-like cysteine peptidase n=2 Tax=Chitinilyticum piscinae TaxID=2866724 RepID=A0A8J7FMR3_9NEIS|nr:transglutaminase-like cysteine peptidase [Chitinilyticum piscinae]
MLQLYAGGADFSLSDTDMDKAEAKWGGARKRLQAWQKLLESGTSLPTESAKLQTVNRFFNQISFVSDAQHWNKPDYWATPVEMLGSNGGDCEDFAIGKYFTLLQIGIPLSKLRITYVKALNWNPVDQAHMVLAYYETPKSEPLILDNLIPEIKPASQRQDLIPVYSFNGEGLWLAKERGSGKPVGGSDRIGLWKDLTSRLGQELN